MKRIYSAADLQEVYLLKGLIEHQGIAVRIVNEHAQGAVGEIPFVEAFPELWVVEDNNEKDALKFVAEYQRRQQLSGEFPCLKCGEMNPASFELCWRCGCDLAVTTVDKNCQ